MPAAAPSGVQGSQATRVEQSRAVAEVQGSIVAAKAAPRDLSRVLTDMRQSCDQKALAERAFFRFGRGSAQVSGPSVHLARELARCWGNCDYGIVELARDDEAGMSEMRAFAIDLQTNARSTNTFLVPHVRHTKQATKKLTDPRDIYENNANAGARRMRECILNMLPSWFTEEAKAICLKRLQLGDDGQQIPLPQMVANCIDAFATIGIVGEQLEKKLGRATTQWVHADVVNLRVVFGSIKNGETTLDEEFPNQLDPAAMEAGIAAQATAKAQPKKTTAKKTKPAAAKGNKAETKSEPEPEKAEEPGPEPEINEEPEPEQQAEPDLKKYALIDHDGVERVTGDPSVLIANYQHLLSTADGAGAQREFEKNNAEIIAEAMADKAAGKAPAKTQTDLSGL